MFKECFRNIGMISYLYDSLKKLLPFRKFLSFHFLSSIDLELTMKPALDLVLKLISQISFTAINLSAKVKPYAM